MSEELSLIDGFDGRCDRKDDPGASVIVARSAGPDGGIIDSFLEDTCRVYFAKTAVQIMDIFQNKDYDLVLIDSNLPDMDCISAIKLIRSLDTHPYLIVRAETDEEIDRVLALEIGADDCVAFSCGYRELKARIRAFFRRYMEEAEVLDRLPAPLEHPPTSKPNFFGWILDKDRCELLCPAGSTIDLTQAEYLILSALFGDPNTIKDRHSLTSLNHDAQHNYSDRSLDVFVSRIRKKIATVSSYELIQTVRGKGYRLIGRPAEVTGTHDRNKAGGLATRPTNYA